MESNNRPSWLEGREIHGFHTIDDLDIAGILNEAGSRWLRPNEIHAMLFNHTHFPVNAKPVNLPQSGTIVFFDRKVLRNFRKDGHNWKKKRDGKTVKEAHEHLKVGSEERIHVYYAHGEDNPNFVRRCYWLLDKSLEHIVLVHYRETTQEIQGSPTTPLNSQSASDVSNLSASRFLPDETNYVVNGAIYIDAEGQLGNGGHRDDKNMSNHEKKLRELNTLEWDELLASNSSNNLCTSTRDNYTAHWYDAQSCQLLDHSDSPKLEIDGDNSHLQSMECPMDVRGVTEYLGSIIPNSGNTEDNLTPDVLPNQDSFGIWMNDVIADSPGSVDNPVLGSSLLTNHVCDIPSSGTNLSTVSQQVFHIVEISHSWVPLNEDTKILVIGNFCEKYKNLERSNLFCIYGDTCAPAEVVQVGVYRCLVSHNTPGLLNLYLSLDGREPISQVINFEFRALSSKSRDIEEDKSAWDGFHIQWRLAHLLLSTCKTLEISDNLVSQKTIKEATRFSLKCSNIRNSWSSMTKLIENNQMSLSEAKERLFEVTLKNRLKDWLLERVVLGSKISECDGQGQGVLHLCAILGYTWAVYPFSVSGLSLDFRDKFGWTALHWAAYCGREKMVGALLSAGAKPNSVTDPIHNNPGGFTAADLALKKGYEGLAAYLSEKALVQQVQDMKLAGHVSGSLEITTNKDPNLHIQSQSNLSYQGEDEIVLKDTLAAYRTAAEAAARIQVAFRERSFKIRAKAIHSTDEMETRYAISAMRIQHAYRKYEMKKQMAAAVRIQYGFQTWKLRREFLRMRQKAIKIQAAFRGYQMRRQYNKVLWSVGIVEKAILRWRLRRKGFRGFQVKPDERLPDPKQEEISCEEDFFRAGRRQAEERVEKAVVRVQAMFRSKKVQQEYRRIKLAHDQAKLDYLRGSD